MRHKISPIDLGSTLVGYIPLDDGKNILIDSGMGEDHAKQILKTVGKVSAVYLTHFHADHSGGAFYFAKLGAEIYMPAIEISFLHRPELNAALLYGGVPPAIFQKPFFRTRQSEVKPLTESSGEIIAIPSYGHSIGHTSYMYGKTLFLGDSLISPEVLEKHGILYNYCPERTLKSCELISTLDFEDAIISHKAHIEKSVALEYTKVMKKHINDLFHKVKLLLGKTSAEIAANIMDEFSLKITPQSILLAESAIKGYLTALEKMGECQMVFEDGKMKFVQHQLE
jgi:glyoxylase-like metal-dependent hydrolase (beta-lactamase superfamily II)